MLDKNVIVKVKKECTGRYKMKNLNTGSLLPVPRGEFEASINVLENAGMKPWMLNLLRSSRGELIAKRVISVFIEIKLKEWQEFYKKYFDLEIDVFNVILPDPIKNFDKLIIVVPSLTIGKVFDVMSKHFKCSWTTDKWDGQWHFKKEDILNYVNSEAKNYAFWVRDSSESDQKYLGKLTDENRQVNCPIENMLEALLHIFKVWDESGEFINSRTNLLTYCDAFQGVLISINYRGAGIVYVNLFYGFARPEHCGPREKIV